MISKDFQKVFDILEYKVILEKMTSRFMSYLANRKFFASLHDVFSEAGILRDAVVFLEGLCWANLVFNVFMTSVNNYRNVALIFILTAHVFSTKTNKKFSVLLEWFVDNKLSIHFG